MTLSCPAYLGAVPWVASKIAAPRLVVDVGSGRDADATDLRRQRVADVVAVEVHGGDDLVLGRPGQDLLQEGVGNDVLDDDALGSLCQGPPSHGTPPNSSAAT